MFKKISAVGVSCVTAIVLMLSAFISPASVSAVSLETMATTAIECIISHEGTYNSVNPNDCGAVSVGMLQWHASRALTVMRRTAELNPEFAQTTLGESFYNDVMTSTNWNSRTFNSTEAKAAGVLLSSEYGEKAQNAQASEDVQSYIVSGQNKGLTDPGALVLYADIYNFGCGIASRIAKRAASYSGSYASVTLDDMYKAAMNDSYGSNSAFVKRTNNVYEYIKSLDWSSTDSSDTSDSTGNTATTTEITTTTTTATILFTEDGAGTYTVKASSLNMRSGPGTGYSIVTRIPNESVVEVTATGAGWAEVTYQGFEGYCSMDYLIPYVETATTTAVTVTTANETTTTTTASEAMTTTTATTETEAATTTATTTTETETTTTVVTTEAPAETTKTTVSGADSAVRTDVIVNSSYATVYGDVNNDGAVTVADAVLLHKYLVGMVDLNLEQVANSDVTYDGRITTADVTVIMQHLSGHFTALPIV